MLKVESFSGDEFPFDLQSDAKEEDDHQEVAHQQLEALQMDRHEVRDVLYLHPVFQRLFNMRTQVEGQRLVPDSIVGVRRYVRPDERRHRGEKQQAARKRRAGDNASQFF